jgi:predicted nucleotide-binding protein
MARRVQPPIKRSAELTVVQLQSGMERLAKVLDRARQFDPLSVTEQYNIPHVEQLSAAIKDALARTFGHDSVEYDRYQVAAEFNNGPHNYAFKVAIREVQRSLQRSKDRNIALLEQAFESLKERLAEQEADRSAEVANTDTSMTTLSNTKVFIVHGHDDAALHALARFVEHLDLEAIVLREQPNAGRTIIEKFVEFADTVGFAIVLLTPDDLVDATAATGQVARARQNAIFELGYFTGKLGRGKVCLVRKDNVEIPSDLYGVIYIDMDRAEGWKRGLAREMIKAGLHFDPSKIL